MTTVNIENLNSIGITVEMRRIGATDAELIGSGHSDGDPNNPNSLVTFYAITNPANGFEFRVADTNGDPVWEEEDMGAFAELAEDCGVEF